jgi:tight adherence protein B
VIVVVALAVGVLVFGAALLAMTARRRASVLRRMSPYVPARDRKAIRVSVDRGELVGRVERLLERFGVHRKVTAAIDRAGFDLRPGVLACADAAVGAVAFVFFAGRSGVGAAVVAALVALALPWVVLGIAGARRSRAFENQLPEVLDALAASLRAGHGFDTALQTVATDVAEPASREFRRVVAEVHLGRSLDDALADLGKRIRSADLKFVLDAITIQRQIGGSLAELFELVAETVRSREQFRRKVKALTGMVRTSANVLTALPFAAALLLTSLNHDYMRPLWTTNGGHLMVGIGLGMMILGTITLRRIGTVKG